MAIKPDKGLLSQTQLHCIPPLANIPTQMTFLHTSNHTGQNLRPFHLTTEFVTTVQVVRSPHIEEFASPSLRNIGIDNMRALTRLVNAVKGVTVPDAEKSSLPVIIVADQNFAVLLESGLHEVVELGSREYLLESILALETDVFFQDLHKQLCYLFPDDYAVFMREVVTFYAHPVHITIVLLCEVADAVGEVVPLLGQVG